MDRPTPKEIVAFRDENGCSIREARKILYRKYLGSALRSKENVKEVIHVLIEILELEFGPGTYS